MVHKAKLLEIIEDLKTPSVGNLNALDFLYQTAEYAKGYHGEKVMSDEVARRVHAVFVTGLKQGAYKFPQERRIKHARYLYHRPEKELGLA